MSTMGTALLERAIGYLRGRLIGVEGRHLGNPTPCGEWTLGDLLLHLEDSVDTFSEAARGAVPPPYDVIGGPGWRPDPARLRGKLGALLGAWSAGGPQQVRLGDRALPARTLLEAAALELAVHGWDVDQALGGLTPLPEGLAGELMEVAARLVTPDVRSGRFADPIGPCEGAVPEGTIGPSGRVLLGFLGRDALASHLSHP